MVWNQHKKHTIGINSPRQTWLDCSLIVTWPLSDLCRWNRLWHKIGISSSPGAWKTIKHFVCKALIKCVFFTTGNAFPLCNPRIAPLVVAYETGCFDLVEKLLDERADANVRDEHLEIAVWIWFHRLWSLPREISCVFHSLPFDF